MLNLFRNKEIACKCIFLVKEDDLQEAIAENATSLAEIDEALISAPADGDLLQVNVRL